MLNDVQLWKHLVSVLLASNTFQGSAQLGQDMTYLVTAK